MLRSLRDSGITGLTLGWLQLLCCPYKEKLINQSIACLHFSRVEFMVNTRNLLEQTLVCSISATGGVWVCLRYNVSRICTTE